MKIAKLNARIRSKSSHIPAIPTPNSTVFLSNVSDNRNGLNFTMYWNAVGMLSIGSIISDKNMNVLPTDTVISVIVCSALNTYAMSIPISTNSAVDDISINDIVPRFGSICDP